MERSFIVWHITGDATIHCLSVAHSCKKKKIYPKPLLCVQIILRHLS